MKDRKSSHLTLCETLENESGGPVSLRAFWSYWLDSATSIYMEMDIYIQA